MAAPKLRFKEFDGDWVKTNFGKVASHISYGLTVRPEYIENGIKLISAREISTGNIDFDNAPKISISDFMLLSDKAKPQKYDLFLSKTGSIGFTSIVETDEKFAITQNIANIRLNNLSEQDPYFFLQQMRTTSFQLKAISVVNQSTIMDLQLGDIKKLEIGYPSKEEQTKIASFLSNVDEKISQLTQKHELLSQYKQGMMQKLFSQQIRFKADDGSEFGEWNKFLLGDCVDILTNGLSLDQNMNGNGFKVTRIETISNFNIDLSRVGYVDTQSDISSYRLVVGDILFSNINSIAHIGKVVYIDKDYDIYHGMNLLRIQFKKNLDKKFMFYELSQKTFKQHFESIANKAVNQASINQTALKKTELCAPCLEEQIKIANFLSAIDQKIEVVAEQIEQAKTWKKGLLQQMFI